MFTPFYKKITVTLGVVIASVLMFTSVAQAKHSWGGYHWARTANPFTLQLGDNVSGVWDAHLATTSSDWSQSSVLDTKVVQGFVSPKTCRATNGRVEVCNSKYGNNGWLGIAQIWVNSDWHITKGATKMNDTYFNTAKYNTPAWRNLVMCQEIGHTLGLDHQDENFNNPNLGTCMDYTSNPESNQHPNAHDYEQLETIYASHTDPYSTLSSFFLSPLGKMRVPFVSQAEDIDLDDPREWGQAVRGEAKEHASLYVRDLGQGEQVFTFVVWADHEGHEHE